MPLDALPQPATDASAPGVCSHCGSLITGREFARVIGPGWTSIHGDGVRALLEVPAGTVDAIITDPPYGSGGFSARDRMQPAKKKYVSTGAAYAAALPEIDGDAIRPAAWSYLMRSAFAAARYALAPGGHLACFIDWRNLPELANLLHESGLTVRGFVPWDKGLSARPMRGGFRAQCEYVLWATNGARVFWEGAPYLPGCLRHTTRTNGKRHITEKPLGLMRDLVQICPPGGLIADCFQGSGTTGVAALEAGRRYLGAESVAGNHAVACDRLAAAVAAQ